MPRQMTTLQTIIESLSHIQHALDNTKALLHMYAQPDSPPPQPSQPRETEDKNCNLGAPPQP